MNKDEDIDVVSCDDPGPSSHKHDYLESEMERDGEKETNMDISHEPDEVGGQGSQQPVASTSLDPVSDHVVKNTEKSVEKTKIVKLPLSKIKHMMKMEPDCHLISQDAVFLVTKATEMFLEFLSKEMAKQISGTKRKTLLKKDVDSVIDSIPHLCFLDGVYD